MKIRLGTVDGGFHESKIFSEAELQEYIDQNGGKIFTGDLEHFNRPDITPREMVEAVASFLEYRKDYDHQTLTLEMYEGTTRKFNVRHVVWWEVVDD